jgi:TRAP-type C4-dicarboxylate transport system permease small subunit
VPTFPENASPPEARPQGGDKGPRFISIEFPLMRKLIDGYCRLLTWLMVATVAILVVPVSLQIVARYTQLIPSYIWTEELSRFLFIWMVMLGAMIGIKEGTHFEVDVWPELSRRGNAVLKIVSSSFVLIFALVFVYWGIKFVEFGWYQESELAELPMPFIFVAWPVTGVTWVIFLGEIFFDNIRVLAGKSNP